MQTQASEQIVESLDAFRAARDKQEEQMFFSVYGSPILQTFLGVNEDSIVRRVPETSLETTAAQRVQADAYLATLKTGGFDEALTRATLYVIAADRSLDQRCALALNVARQQFMHLSLAEFKTLVRDQFFVLQLEPKRAVEAIASIVPEVAAREDLVKQVRAIVMAADPLSAAQGDRLDRLSQSLGLPSEKPVSPETSDRPKAVRAAARPDAALH